MPCCMRCLKPVYLTEQKIAIGRVWHSFCFSCCVCKKLLDQCCFDTDGIELFCHGCYRGFALNLPPELDNPLPGDLPPKVLDSKTLPCPASITSYHTRQKAAQRQIPGLVYPKKRNANSIYSGTCTANCATGRQLPEWRGCLLKDVLLPPKQPPSPCRLEQLRSPSCYGRCRSKPKSTPGTPYSLQPTCLPDPCCDPCVAGCQESSGPPCTPASSCCQPSSPCNLSMSRCQPSYPCNLCTPCCQPSPCNLSMSRCQPSYSCNLCTPCCQSTPRWNPCATECQPKKACNSCMPAGNCQRSACKAHCKSVCCPESCGDPCTFQFCPRTKPKGCPSACPSTSSCIVCPDVDSCILRAVCEILKI